MPDAACLHEPYETGSFVSHDITSKLNKKGRISRNNIHTFVNRHILIAQDIRPFGHEARL